MPAVCAGRGQYRCDPSLPNRTGSDHQCRQTRRSKIHRCEPERLCRSAKAEELEWWGWIPCGCEREKRAGLADYAISSGDDRSDTQNCLGERRRHDGRAHVQYQSMSRANSTPKRTRLLIVDDHPITRAGLVHLINRQPDMVVCGEAKNAAEALNAVDADKPDLVLADITLPGKSGLELIKDIKAIQPGLPTLVISMHDESLYAERFLRAVARGDITKHEGGEKLMQAIRHVLSGQIYVSEKMSAHILKILSGGQAAPVRSLIAQLSDREFEVFELLGEGVSAHEIARRLHISTKTVDAHRANIKTKLIIKTTSEPISYAARWMEHRWE